MIPGMRIIREDVAKFISRRDGYAANLEDIILTSGGAHGIRVHGFVPSTHSPLTVRVYSQSDQLTVGLIAQY